MEDDVVVLADASGVIRFWSGGAERAFGYTHAAAIGRTLDLIVPPEHRKTHWGGFTRAIQSGVAAVEGQAAPFPVQCANGEVVPWLGRLTLVRHPGGGVVAAIVAFDRLSPPSPERRTQEGPYPCA